MANTSSFSSLDKWRDFFGGANSDIFEIIKHAIMVAAFDCPYDFKLNRDRIAEMLFTCKSTKCFGCDRTELTLPNDHDGVEKSDDKYRSGIESKDTKESKSNCSYGDAEALTDEMEDESQMLGEVLRIKEIIDNSEEQSDSVLFDSLKRLQLMPLSIETLKATEIGKSVNSLRKHVSKNIRNLVRTLVEDWKNMVDEFYKATEAIAGAEVTPESGEKSVVEEEEEEGLPSAPLDEAAFFSTPSAMEMSQFFDGMDDDGNLQNSGEFNKNGNNNRRPNIVKTDDRKPEPKEKQEAMFKEAPSCKPNRHNGVESGSGRPKPPSDESRPGRPKPMMQFKARNEVKVQQKHDQGSIQKKQAVPKQEKLNCKNEASVHLKLEAAKRKLQERYQEAENAKKQKTIQVVELRDLPKQRVAQRNRNVRPGNHNRHWANNQI